ncbi:hypothetical protein [Tropicibacter sp. Alg240-R139]|uniref:hypothetical protein n=1 Tax=Tropicibacter sp. Alg240-R139 TaxID=2305991 RepID=UPI0013E03DC2|nr:hypothetical protein [Tropicibacter sp. Alg240-R139]
MLLLLLSLPGFVFVDFVDDEPTQDGTANQSCRFIGSRLFGWGQNQTGCHESGTNAFGKHNNNLVDPDKSRTLAEPAGIFANGI